MLLTTCAPPICIQTVHTTTDSHTYSHHPWQMIPVNGRVVIRMNLTDFTGPFPFHCHVTAHQDIGMMQLVEIVDGNTACPSS